MEQKREMNSMLNRVSGLGTALMSLLRGSFDFVIPCVVDASGNCQFPASQQGDTQDLERCVGRPVLGSSLNGLLADDSERERFASYVKNMLKQGTSPQLFEGLSQYFGNQAGQRRSAQMPPVAPVLHVKLAREPSAEMQGRREGDDEGSHIDAIVYVATVPGIQGYAVLGLRLSPLEKGLEKEDEWTAGSLPKESGCKARRLPFRALRRRSAQGGRSFKFVRSCEMSKPLRRRVWHAPEASPEAEPSTACLDDELELGFDWWDRQTSGASTNSGPFGGAWSAHSQSSRVSFAGSITMACRQLVGPLHDHLPPPQLQTKRMEDHVHCAAEMVGLRAGANIKKLHYDQQMGEWQKNKLGHTLFKMMQKTSGPDEAFDEQVWRSKVLPYLEHGPPGPKPRDPLVPDDTQLWYQAWQATFAEEDDDEEEEDEDSEHEHHIGRGEGAGASSSDRHTPGGAPAAAQRGPFDATAHAARLTFRTDPRVGFGR